MSGREFQERLRRRARRAGLAIAQPLGAQLEAYYRLLATWNQRINLTGFDLSEGWPEALDRLLIEPLMAARHVASNTERVIDIGSGGGSPAIPLTLALPRLMTLMVEAKTRKSVFLREALRILTLNRAQVVTARFEELLSDPDLHEAHDLLTLRAVRVEAKVLMNLQAFVRPGGEIFLFRSDADVSGALTPPLTWKATYPLLEARGSRLIALQKVRFGRQEDQSTERGTVTGSP